MVGQLADGRDQTTHVLSCLEKKKKKLLPFERELFWGQLLQASNLNALPTWGDLKLFNIDITAEFD